MNKKIVGVGMSGGVDSSVSAYLLKQQGYEVLGITMWLVDDEKSKIAINDAKKVCEQLNIKHYVIDFRNKFNEIVIKNFIDSYKKGFTPNPCTVCNKYFKFGLFFEEAKKLGCNYISTGHYAKIQDGKLYRALLKDKDQSYFMYGINKDVLKYVILPLQDYTDKEEIRKIAKDINLIVNDKKESQEICFVPNDDYKTYLKDVLDEKPKIGEICLKDGTVLGKHNGLCYYTIGQRKGLNVSYKEPLYVMELDVKNNRLIVGTNSDLFKCELIASEVNLLVDSISHLVYAKIRSRSDLKRVFLEFIDKDKVKVKFSLDERAITPGQAIVFYDDNDCCLGGGIIQEVL